MQRIQADWRPRRRWIQVRSSSYFVFRGRVRNTTDHVASALAAVLELQQKVAHFSHVSFVCQRGTGGAHSFLHLVCSVCSHCVVGLTISHLIFCWTRWSNTRHETYGFAQLQAACWPIRCARRDFLSRGQRTESMPVCCGSTHPYFDSFVLG